MKRSLFLRLFPPPNYLARRPVGVDLSDRSLKYCRDFKISGEVPIPAGVIENGRLKNAQALVEILRAAAKNFGSKYVVAALPEEPGFTFVLALPAASRAELRQAIELQLEEHIPLPAAGVVFDYEILREPAAAGEPVQVVVSAFPKNLAQEYFQVFTDAGLVVAAFDNETQAMARSLFRPGDRDTRLVVDFGRARVSLFVVSSGLSVLTSTINSIGGQLLSRAIVKNLGVGIKEAKELKDKYGLLTGKNRAVADALLPAVSVLRDEIGEFLAYWEAQVCKSQGCLSPIKSAVLCGGQALLPGLAEYLSASLNLEFTVGNVWANILDAKSVKPPIPLQESVRQAVTFGLVLRQVSEK